MITTNSDEDQQAVRETLTPVFSKTSSAMPSGKLQQLNWHSLIAQKQGSCKIGKAILANPAPPVRFVGSAIEILHRKLSRYQNLSASFFGYSFLCACVPLSADAGPISSDANRG